MDTVTPFLKTSLRRFSNWEVSSSELYWVKLVCHALTCATVLTRALIHLRPFGRRRAQPSTWPFFGTFIMYLCLSFGGGLFTAVFQRLPIFFWSLDGVFLIWLSVWCFALYLRPVFRLLSRCFLIKLVYFLFSSLITIEVIMEIGEEIYSGWGETVFSPIIFMNIMGTGGGYVYCFLVNVFTNKKVPFPLVEPSGYLYVVFFLSIFYYVFGLRGLMPTYEFSVKIFADEEDFRFRINVKVVAAVLMLMWCVFDCVRGTYGSRIRAWCCSTKKGSNSEEEEEEKKKN